jgi:dienelactone hydrolase
LSELQAQILQRRSELDFYRARGPFEVGVREDVPLAAPGTSGVIADIYLSSAQDRAPLAIVVHGHGNGKDDHAYQCLHLASWGIHSLCVELASEGPWERNARTLAALVRHLQRNPESVDPRVDPRSIVLAGHSFGAYAVALALAEGAPAAGGVLLDPASPTQRFGGALRKIRAPMVVLMADPKLGQTNGGGDFYAYTASGIAQVSIAEATHDDGTFPIESPLSSLFSASGATETAQITFVSALTASALSLGLTGKLDYAWANFADGIKQGKLFDALRK